MNDDSFTLNIQVPVRKPQASVSQTADRRNNRKFDRMQQREASRQPRGPQRRFGSEDGRSHSRGDKLMDNSRKIKKQPKMRRQPNIIKYDENANVEEVLNVDEKKDEEVHIFAGETFEELPGLNPKLLAALQENKYVTLTKIQKESIPAVMKNKNCIIKAETGSGKTLAYLTPIINQMSLREDKIKREDGTFCIVICPTRELCVQVVETAKLLLKCAVNIVCGAIMGGESIKKEKARLRKGTNILVCTPGRLVYHMQNTASFNYVSLKYIVFEESDRTLDMGFKKELEEIIAIVNSRKDYESIQKILISANFSEKIQALSMKLTPKDCVHLGFQPKMEEEEEGKTNEGNKGGDETYFTPSRLNQKYVVVEEGKRITFLLSILVASENSKIMIFVATCDEVEALEMIFENATYKPAVNADGRENEESAAKLITGKIFKLHGKIDQKTRTKTYLDFKKASEGILLCTDVASRGLDFDDVKLIVQLDPPETITDYINRMGRTARIGNYGMSLLFLTGTELGYVDLLTQKGIKIEEYEKGNYDAFIQAKLQHELTEDNSDIHNFLSYRIRSIMRADIRHKIKARKAYISYVRAYARQKEKAIFHPKKLNLERLAKSFGLVTSKTVKNELDSEGFLPRTLFKEKGRSRRGPSTRKLENLEFM